jgi:hypothetical protein
MAGHLDRGRRVLALVGGPLGAGVGTLLGYRMVDRAMTKRAVALVIAGAVVGGALAGAVVTLIRRAKPWMKGGK